MLWDYAVVLPKEDMTFGEKYKCTCMTHHRVLGSPWDPKSCVRGAWGRRVAGQFRREDQWGLRFLEKALQVRALGLLGNGRCQDTDRGQRDEQVCGEPWRDCLYFSTWRLWKDLGLWVLKSLVGNGEQGVCSWSVCVSWVEDQEALVKAFAPAVLLLGVYPREMKAYVHVKTCVSTCMAALFITPQNWKWPSCPSMREWLSKLWVHSHHRRLLIS